MSKYQILMSDEAWDQFWQYVRLVPGEVGCFGYATLHPEDQIVVVDEIFLVPQESDASQVDFIETGLPYAIEKAAKDGRLDDLRFCIHSHGNHGAFWSSTDEDMIRKMGLTSGWFASVIFNKAGNTAARIDVFDVPPLGKMQVTLKDLDVYPFGQAESDEQAIADLEYFVAKPKPAPTKAEKVKAAKQKSVMSPEAAAKAAKELDDEPWEWSPQEFADEMGYYIVVEQGVRYYLDESGDVKFQESLVDDHLDQLAWGDELVDVSAVSDELTEEEVAELMRASGWVSA